MPKSQRTQSSPEHFKVNPKGIADAFKRERIGGATAVDPLPRLGERPPLAGATQMTPALENIDGIDQHSQHQTLLAAQSSAANRTEILAGQYDVSKLGYVSNLSIGMMH